MTPKKPELLDVLREQQRRKEGPGEPGAQPPPRAPSKPRRPLPPWLLLLGAAVLVLGLVWLLSGLFGSGESYVVRAATWFGAAQEQQAKADSLELLGQLPPETDYDLRRLQAEDGTVRFVLLLGEASDEADLRPLLDTVRAASLPSSAVGARPFADAAVVLSSEITSS